MSNDPNNIPRVTLGILIYDEEDKIFLARSYKWPDKWVVPGGKLDWGESLEEAAKREVREETGLEIDKVELVGIQESVFSAEFHQQKHFIFMDFKARLAGGEVILNDELQEYQWFTAEDALKLELAEPTRKFIINFIDNKSIRITR